MRVARRVILLFLLIAIIFYWFDPNEEQTYMAVDQLTHELVDTNKYKQKEIPENIISDHILQENLFKFLYHGEEELIDTFGEPNRKDMSSYGYTWWIYKVDETKYYQFGIEDGEVKTIFATGRNVGLHSFKLGDSYDQVNESFSFSSEVSYDKGIESYTFQLDKDDLLMRPLVQIGKNVFMQLYFDTFTNELSSLRIMTGDILLQHRPYALKYRGELPEQKELTDDDWDQVEKGMERQIFDITNVIRNTFNQNSVEWEEDVREVAYLHSKDMATNNYFSHYNPDGEGLKQRLGNQDIFYFSAGENIAALYVDAPAAVEGWLNSEGHREALLNNDFTHLGVGVYRYYYTQNFLSKP